MFRQIISGVIILSFFGSCHKGQVNQPATQTGVTSNFKDDHIFVSSISIKQEGPSLVNINFTTRFEKNIVIIEVFGGSTTKNLCSIFKRNITEDSHTTKTYKAVDDKADSKMNFYMVKYTNKNGDWAYSELYKIEMK